MSKLRTGILIIATCAIAAGADFTGRWKGTQVRENGGRRDYEFVLKPEGAKLTGMVAAPNGDFQISEGAVKEDSIVFFVVPGPGRRQRYTATLKGEELHVALPGPQGSQQELVAKRVSRDPVPPPPPVITIPELRTLPPNGLAKTPPMGWNSWNKFAPASNDQLIREIADAMVTSGMKDAGYVYVNIDDSWEGGRDASGNIQTNEKFPDMKALADYVHSKGLKLGIYSSPGPRTCAGFEGSYSTKSRMPRPSPPGASTT